MADAPIVFALANPDPEISYPDALGPPASDVLMATGRSDYPNQVNNVLGFPFIFRGALDVRARAIDEGMKVAAARALAELAKEDVPDSVLRAYGVDRLEFGPEYLIPKPLDPRVPLRVAPAVAAAAMASGVARNPLDLAAYTEQLANRLTRGREVMSMVDPQGADGAQARGLLRGRGAARSSCAAARIQQEQIGLPILLGREERHPVGDEGAAESPCPSRSSTPATSERADSYAAALHERRQRKGITLREARALLAPAELLRRHDGAGRRRRRVRRRPDLPLSRRHPAGPGSDRVARPMSRGWPGCT